MKRNLFVRLTGTLSVIALFCSTTLMAQQKWPYPIPARIGDSNNKDLFIMTLGEIQTPLADGVFDPAKESNSTLFS
jgi:hypothetical protein